MANQVVFTVIILGAFVQRYLNWRWVFWIQLIVGGLAQALHFFIVPETRSTVLLENAAKKLREEGREKEADAVAAPKPVLDLQHILTVWSRPVCAPFVFGFVLSPTETHRSCSSRCSFESLLCFF